MPIKKRQQKQDWFHFAFVHFVSDCNYYEYIDWASHGFDNNSGYDET